MHEGRWLGPPFQPTLAEILTLRRANRKGQNALGYRIYAMCVPGAGSDVDNSDHVENY
jgi:hypothetical protein